LAQLLSIPKRKWEKIVIFPRGSTIGIMNGGKNAGLPVIGDRVYIGPNAIVIDGIHIGNDAAFGAGVIVTKSVPDRAVVIGNPSKIISYKGSFEYIQYFNMESVSERINSLALAEFTE